MTKTLASSTKFKALAKISIGTVWIVTANNMENPKVVEKPNKADLSGGVLGFSTAQRKKRDTDD